MQQRISVIFGVLLVLGLSAFGGWWGMRGREEAERPERRPAAVRVAAVEVGSIETQRTYSGSLEATAQFIVAPKTGGRIEELALRIADKVTRGQVVARLDNAEHQQAVAGAEAEFAVAEANLMEARNALITAERELGRVSTLRERGVSSESQFDAAHANFLARQSQTVVADAQLTRAESALATARIQLGYTEVTADWSDDTDEERFIAERYVNEGDTVSANDPLFLVVELDPITAVIFVTERDYSRLRVDQPVTLQTDAFPGRNFEGRIVRISPIFSTTSRQARVEIEIPNVSQMLKPGMFVRATVVLDRVEDATIVPRTAITRRQDRDGVFVLSEDGNSVRWQPVELGVESARQVEVKNSPELGKWVVTLGQSLLDDGSAVRLPEGRGGQSVGGDAGTQ